jgi:polar amino acid transport system substrate-binding protein
MKKILFIALVGVMLATMALTACNSSTTTTKYQIATDATWPPFEYVDTTTSQIVGFDIDLMNAIAKKENLNIEFVNVGWDPLLAGMAQGTYDAAISSITILPDRQKDMLFSNPYYAAGQIIVVGINNNTIKGKDTLQGKVAAQLGTTGAIEAAKIAGVELRNYDDIGLAFQDLMNGQVDAVVCDNPVAANYVVKNPDKLKFAGTTFTDESYGIAVSKGNEDLLEKINAGLKAVLAEGIIKTLETTWYK